MLHFPHEGTLGLQSHVFGAGCLAGLECHTESCVVISSEARVYTLTKDDMAEHLGEFNLMMANSKLDRIKKRSGRYALVLCPISKV